ncbi:UbiH/UbiF/VisC/COQ6 family ubiquinone biosynthesis hydroxylase [Pseudoduganella ginsengisoli]|uniref:2-octaprenyl-6-methoxyphenyl hydroxylase n=1 Tax=Pseudoduganella ginsengisoli TaxID=1462440 RepID=A0A6L6PV06_9BURK|nr:FAD-dependent monooxygenase [Pseudoduganella ginsengisoli]MTW01285.1 2-octaprenyl-6-methoxyphenyl hydroxylase [Pseudoduganella ginsengisoli]
MTELVTEYDIAICGAGPAGMALAALLVKRGVTPSRIALIDARTLQQACNDPRSLALSYGSRQILEEIGCWPIPATAINEIHVSRRGQFGRSMITSSEHKLPALGYVTRYGALVAELGAACERLGIAALRPALVTALREASGHVALYLAEELPGGQAAGSDRGTVACMQAPSRTITASIVVQAEGGLFGEQTVKSMLRDYGQTAIIAQVRASRPVAHRAYERFTDEGPLALLPQDDEYSMVWCATPHTTEELMELDDAAFLERLGTAFGSRLGTFTNTSRRVAFPLGLNAGAQGTARIAAIGNAAQTLHPVAGQGLNLGLRDATVLARLLSQGANPFNLAQFHGQREKDRSTTVHLTDAMATLFAGRSPLQAVLGASLAAIDLVSPARGVLAELMMYGRR